MLYKNSIKHLYAFYFFVEKNKGHLKKYINIILFLYIHEIVVIRKSNDRLKFFWDKRRKLRDEEMIPF